MAGKNFDISKFAATLKPVSESDHTGPEQIEYIDISLLDGDERNFYQLTDIDELADNIQMCGLQQPIRVRAGEGGRFTIVSGHRRRAALSQLVEKGLDQFRRVPCIQETDDVSPALQELRLIFANSSTRKLTSAEISEQSKRVEALFYQLKEEGYEFPEGRMRDAVAAACNTKGSQIARVRVIDARLIEELTAMWKRNELPEQSAYTLAKFPPNMQHRIFTVFPKIPTGSTLETLLRLYKDRGYRWEPCMTCPDGKACKRGDAFLRHDAECCGCDVCGGQTCCLECSLGTATYYPCDKACSKAKAKRKEAMDANKAARALHCSADYIVGLTDELTPPTLPEGQLMIAGWMPGSTTPAEPGEFAVYIDLDGKLIPQFFRWTGSRWEMRTGTVPQVPVVWWMRLPPVPSDKKGADT